MAKDAKHTEDAHKKPGLAARITTVNSKLLVLVLVLLLGVVAGLGIYRNITSRQQQEQSSLACRDKNSDIVGEASSAMDPSKPENRARLGEMAERIETYEKYDQDPMCLYILAVYYLDAGDISRASDLLNKLGEIATDEQKVYIEEQPSFLTIENLNLRKTLLEANDEEIISNNPQEKQQ